MTLSEFSVTSPIILDFFKYIYSKIRNIKTGFQERFSLDHNFGTSVDTNSIDCDGYHSVIRYNPYEISTSPDLLSGGIVKYAKKITDNQTLTRTATTTSGSKDITSLNENSLIEVGMKVTGSGIPNNTYVESFTDRAGAFTLTNACTISAENVSLTFTSTFTTEELCIKNRVGEFQLTKAGKIADPTLEISTSNPSYFIDVFFCSDFNVYIAFTEGAIYRSTDGVLWTQVRTSGRFNGVAYGNGKIVAIEESYSIINSWHGFISYLSYQSVVYSSDGGLNWVGACSSQIGSWTISGWPPAKTINNGEYGEGRYVFSSSIGVIFVTDLSSIWTVEQCVNVLNKIKYGNGKFVGVNIGGTQISTSDDGLTWSSINPRSGMIWTSLKFIDNNFFLSAYKFDGVNYDHQCYISKECANAEASFPIVIRDVQRLSMNNRGFIKLGEYYIFFLYPKVLITIDFVNVYHHILSNDIVEVIQIDDYLVAFSTSYNKIKITNFKKIG